MSNDSNGFLRRPSLGAGLAEYLRKAADMVEAGEPIATGTDWVTVTTDPETKRVIRVQADIWLRR